MSSVQVPRALTNAVRQIDNSSRHLYALATKRSASSKHPRGFVSPNAEDLIDLRERVQQFTRGHSAGGISTMGH